MAKKVKFVSPKGMHDILPDNQLYWQPIIKCFEDIAYFCGYNRIDTPIVEPMDLFTQTVGESSDIVSKEFFILKKQSKKDQQYVLRPEFTAPIARAYIEHGLKTLPKPIRLYTHGPVFRYSRPQSGVLRQFHQLNLEQIGVKSASADAELISMCWQLFNNLQLKNINLHINTIGSIESRKDINALLTKYFTPRRPKLCEDCCARLKKNPLRIFDCKQKSCQSVIDEAPQIIDHIDSKSKKHFYELLEYLDELQIPYILNPKLVRGLDYYTNTVFEFIAEDGTQSLGGGGRYDKLYELIGGESTPAVGIALGIERIILKLIENRIVLQPKTIEKPEIFLIQLGNSAKRKCFKLLHELRNQKFKVSSSLSNKSITAQLKKANKQQARMAVIIGEKEAIEHTVIIRDMQTGTQDIIDWDHAIEEISKRLKI